MLSLYLSEIREDRDKEKFRTIYQCYEQKMFSVAYGILRHRENAEDVVHDAFEVIMTRLDVIGDVYSSETWNYIRVIVKNRAIKMYNQNKKRREMPVEDFNLLDDLTEELRDVEIQTEKKEISEIIAYMILELPERYRAVLYLRYYNELSYAEAAEALEMTEANARQLTRRARKKLLEKMMERGIRYE